MDLGDNPCETVLRRGHMDDQNDIDTLATIQMLPSTSHNRHHTSTQETSIFSFPSEQEPYHDVIDQVIDIPDEDTRSPVQHVSSFKLLALKSRFMDILAEERQFHEEDQQLIR